MQKAILCVDDERSILNALQLQIMRAFSDQYLLELAESAHEAIEIIEDFNKRNIQLAMVITDEMMPGMKGHELINHIVEISESTPCMLLTGYAQTEVVDTINENRTSYMLSKPWDAAELVDLIRKATLGNH